jgi:hypothetical protein
MTLKSLVLLPKRVVSAPTRWRSDTVIPRLSPFPKSRPAPPNGVWRSTEARTADHAFMVFAQVQESREDFKAWLALRQADVWQVLVRLVNHGNHPGLHVHDWCGAPQPPIGGRSIDAPHRRPKAGHRHRRSEILSRATFWKLALNCFRVIPSGSDQEELL